MIASVTHGYTQDIPPVSWRFSATPGNAHDAVVHITAHLAPGWHVYSQAIGGGGPVPTRFSFDRGAYALTGPTREEGNAKTYYDEVYEMEITWYTGVVHFEQDILLEHPAATLTGRVEYMVCNNEVCVPGEKAFSVKISP